MRASRVLTFKAARWATVILALICAPIAGHASADYWQQHVSYTISATLIDSIHTLDGTLEVVYINNSPDTLREVYFHLYANAFQPGSLMDERSRALHSNPINDRIAKLAESEWGRYSIPAVRNDGKPTDYEITGTIMHVGLAAPLAPGSSTTIEFPFREQIPRQIRRSGWRSSEGVAYSMSQWYPKIAEYDREGWQIQEYVAREFYGVWGDFDVELKLPSEYTVGATGRCVNPEEAKHGYDLIASGQKDGEYDPSMHSASGMTTWHFKATTVHDFAWVADEDYIHQWSTLNDTITLHSLYKLQVAGLWQKSLEYAKNVLKIYGRLYGPYAYRDFSTTMAGDGGMEYPQLIMITGYRPGLSLPGVIAHEIGHQWFYGMLGSNETRQAFMDEGFTSFATTQAMNKLFGDHQTNPNAERTWLDWFIPEFSNKRDNYRGYQSLASQGYDEPLIIPHDWFREDVTAGQVYGKTQAILSMLQYAIGDEIFDRGMKLYYQTWRFKHPHLIDFQRVMESVAHTKLDWFFDEWFSTTRTVDYQITDLTSKENDHGFETMIAMRNNGLAVMPIELLLHFEDGSSQAEFIPVVLNKDLTYLKPGSQQYLPGWDWVAPEYHGTLTTPKRALWAEIDTSWRLQDLNWSNNYSDRSGLWQPRGYWAVWKQLNYFPPIDGYWAIARPIAWYEELGHAEIGAGLKFGMNLSFSGDAKLIYKFAPDRIENGLPVDPKWYDHLDGALSYSTPIDWFGRLTTLQTNLNKLQGIGTANISVAKVIRPDYINLGPTHTATLYLEFQQKLNDAYPIYHHNWSDGVTEVAGLKYRAQSDDRSMRFDLNGEVSLWDSDHQFARVLSSFNFETHVFSTLPLKFRVAAGSATAWTPVERQFWADRASNYDEQSQTFYRAISGMRSSLDRSTGMFVAGGAGVRGYNSGSSDSLDAALTGTHMLGASIDLSLPNPLAKLGRIPRALTAGIFADAGWVNAGTADLLSDIGRNLRTDIGLSLDVNLLSLVPVQLQGVLQEYSGIPTLGFVFPIYENHPLDGKQPIAFRWALSLGSSF